MRLISVLLQSAIDAGRVDAGQPMDIKSLVEAGIVRRGKDGLRILGGGELSAKITVTADHVTEAARAAIEKAGGSITLVEKKVLAADEEKRAKTAAKKAKADK